MSMFSKQPDKGPAAESGTGFIPEEFVEQRRTRRSTLFYLSLFTVVLMCVAGAFFVTNTEWNEVREYGKAVDVRYKQAAENLEQLNELETRAGTLVKKAEVVLALVERVPRSLLIAELSSAMPVQMTLTDLELKSTKVVPPAPDKAAEKSKKKGSNRKSRTAEEPPAEAEIAPLRYKSAIVLLGIAPTHQDIARYVSSLQGSDLLAGVELKVSETTLIKDRQMIKFRIEGMISPAADPRRAEREAGVVTTASAEEGGTR